MAEDLEKLILRSSGFAGAAFLIRLMQSLQLVF